MSLFGGELGDGDCGLDQVAEGYNLRYGGIPRRKTSPL